MEAFLAEPKHRLVILEPGHFHAALTLRKSHPRLSDEVHVFAEDGPDLDRFLGLVQAFNERSSHPTNWRLHVQRCADPLERLCKERAGDVAIVAGKNDVKMRSIQGLHAAGFPVLGDKPWVIAEPGLPLLSTVIAAAPLAMDIMTERHDVATRLQRALLRRPEVFGVLQPSGSEPALHFHSVHHLYKLVNQRPLVRPAWYFDVAVQGEGITDITTHLVDLAQWMTGSERPYDYGRDVELLDARQWPTEVPREVFERITGLSDFPEALRPRVAAGVLSYLCNAQIDFRLRSIPVRIETRWDLAIPEGGGDTHYAMARGTKADVFVVHSAATAFIPEVFVHPLSGGADYAQTLADAVHKLRDQFPGLGVEPVGAVFRIAIPGPLRTTHEEHFAAVLDEFLGYLDGTEPPSSLGPDLVTKYTLLMRAAEASRREIP
jgi:predicted dehydrogenase